MSIAKALAYAVYDLPLDVAEVGRTLDFQAGYVHVARFQNADGSENATGLVELALALDSSDWMPLAFNSELQLAEPRDRMRLRWSAQPGILCRLVLARDPRQFNMFTPPARTTISTAAGNSVTVGTVSVLNTATVIRAANASRQSLMVQNDGAADVFVGPSTVTTVAGWRVPAGGGVLTLDKSIAAIYGISAVSGQPVRFLEEA